MKARMALVSILLTFAILVPTWLYADTVTVFIEGTESVGITINPNYPGDTFWFVETTTNIIFPPDTQTTLVQLGTFNVNYSAGNGENGNLIADGSFLARDITIAGITQTFIQNYHLQIRPDYDTLTIDGVAPLIFNLPGGQLILALQPLSVSSGNLGPSELDLIGEVTFRATPVPEPTTILLIGAGFLGLAVFRKKIKK